MVIVRWILVTTADCNQMVYECKQWQVPIIKLSECSKLIMIMVILCHSLWTYWTLHSPSKPACYFTLHPFPLRSSFEHSYPERYPGEGHRLPYKCPSLYHSHWLMVFFFFGGGGGEGCTFGICWHCYWYLFDSGQSRYELKTAIKSNAASHGSGPQWGV